MFTATEWITLKKFNKTTTNRVHSADLPLNSSGKPYIIVPHAEFTPEMIDFLKEIGVKATFFINMNDLEVKDEDVLSEGDSLLML